MERRYTYEDYTAAWISALECEYFAASVMFDEVHGSNVAPRPPGDDSLYLYGRIGEHNVVMACLTDQGGANATALALSVKYTFKNIRIALMVGIGGGVPSERHDIRLGDVAVSRPENNLGGTMEWTRGRLLAGQGFDRTGHLNRPPEILLRAATEIKRREITSHVYVQVANHWTRHAVAALRNGSPDFRAMYQSLGTPDRLFCHTFRHVGRKGDCSQCPHSWEISRRPRQGHVVHHGLIGSGSAVVKDGELRHELSEAAEDLICLETEACGLMNHFPSLIIRGISDYADSHKNDAWQNFASLVAAAYAKEILIMVPARAAGQI